MLSVQCEVLAFIGYNVLNSKHQVKRPTSMRSAVLRFDTIDYLFNGSTVPKLLNRSDNRIRIETVSGNGDRIKSHFRNFSYTR